MSSQIGLNALRGWTESTSLLSISKKDTDVPPGLGPGRLLSSIHSSANGSAGLVEDLKSSVQGLLQTKLLECGAKAHPERSSIGLKAQETSPFASRSRPASPHGRRSVFRSSPR